MLITLFHPAVATPTGPASVGEVCAALGARVDPALADECVWTKNAPGGDALRAPLARALGARWTSEDGILWLRPDPTARAKWDRAGEDRDDARFLLAAAGRVAPTDEAVRQAATFARSSTDDPIARRVRRLQRVNDLLWNNPEIARAFDDAHLGRMEEGETRAYGDEGRPMPRRLSAALTKVRARLDLAEKPAVGEASIVVSRVGDAFSFTIRFANEASAGDFLALPPEGSVEGTVSLRPSPVSRLFRRALRGGDLLPEEAKSVEAVAAREPLALLAGEALEAEFQGETRPTLVVLRDDRLGRLAEGDGRTAPRLGSAYRRLTEDGWRLVVPVRLGETTRLRASRSALRAILARSPEELRAACAAATPLAEAFRLSAAAPTLRALRPDLYRFYSANDWRWVRAVGAFGERTYREASGEPLALDRVTTAEVRPLAPFFGALPTRGTLLLAPEETDAFQVDGVKLARRLGVGMAVTDRTPEAYGASLKEEATPDDATLFRVERVRVRVMASQGEATGEVVWRRRVAEVRGGDLSGLPPAIRERVERARSG